MITISSVISSNTPGRALSSFSRTSSLSSFLQGQISECPKLWKTDIQIPSRLGHDLLLQCLHQAAICKALADDVLPLLKATVQHYTLVALTQQTGKKQRERRDPLAELPLSGPIASDTYETSNTLDCSIILIDSIVSSYIDIDEDLNAIGRLAFDTLFNTLLTVFNNDHQRLVQLPLLDYLMHNLFNHCHDRMWYSKQGACRFLSQLCLTYFPRQFDWYCHHLPQILHGCIHVIISLTDEISSGTLDTVSTLIKDLLDHYAQSPTTDQHREPFVGLLLNYVFSPISYLRTLVYQSLRQLSQAFQQSIPRLIEPFKKDLIKKFSPSHLLPLKNQSLIYQITYLDAYIFFRTLEPKVSYITLFDDDLFKELTTFIAMDENELIKLSSYRSLTQQQCTLNVIHLKKLAIRTIAEYYEQIDYRDRVLRLFYKMLTTLHSNALQAIVYESIEKMLSGHQNDQLRLRFVDSYLQMISFNEIEKVHWTLPIAQTLFFLSKLSPSSFNESHCEKLDLLIRKLLQNIASGFRTNFDVQNQYYKISLIFLDLLATLPSSSKKIIESLTNFILKFDKHLMIEVSEQITGQLRSTSSFLF